MNNTTEYTIAPSPSFVSVREFRQAIEHLERKIRVDRHSAVGVAEKSRWAEETRRVASSLIATSCKRAKSDDWIRRERAIDRSASLVCSHLLG